jgi:hypothetical protein
MKQTAVDYLFQELWQAPKDKWMWQMILKQALKMEKQQIEDAFDIGFCEGYNYAIRDYNPFFIEGQDYYQETYGKDG